MTLVFAILALTASPEAAELDEIVVTATRLESAVRDVARSISVADSFRIQSATQQLALDEALAGIPGLYMQNRYNFSQDLRISLRGFGARSSFGIRGIRIFVDGIPETLPDGQSQVDSIDLGSAERIEVLRGPASSLYGNASGGVIAVQSELGNTQPYVEARLATGDFGFRQYQLKAGGEISALDYLLSVSSRNLDGYREHSQSESDLVNAKFGFDFSENDRLVASFNFVDQPVAMDPGGVNAAQADSDPASARARNVLFDTGEAVSQQRAGFHFRHQGESSEFVVRNYYVWRDFNNKLPFVSGGAVDLDRFFYGAGAQYSASALRDERLRWTIGLDADRQDDRRQRYDNNAGVLGSLASDQAEVVTSTGAYLHGLYRWNTSWSMRAGLRFDRVAFDVEDRFLADGDDSGRSQFEEPSYSLSVNYEFSSGVVFAAFSTSFDTPTTTELANPDGSGGFNESLAAQSAFNYEVGLKRFSDSIYIELAAFYIALNDELVPFEVPAFPERTFFANAGKSSRTGIETQATWKLTPGLRVELSYTWSNFNFDEFTDKNGNDFSGKQLPGLPRHFAFARLSYDDEQKFYGAFEINYSGELFANNANDVSVSSYVVGDVRAGYRTRLGRWKLEPYLGVNNIFDESYNRNIRINAFGGRFFEPAPDRNYYAGVVIRFE